MESLLWAINLAVVVYVCFWAIRQDKLEQAESPANDANDASNHS